MFQFIYFTCSNFFFRRGGEQTEEELTELTEASEPEAASSQGEETSGYSSSEKMLLKDIKKYCDKDTVIEIFNLG